MAMQLMFLGRVDLSDGCPSGICFLLLGYEVNISLPGGRCPVRSDSEAIMTTA